MFLIFSWANIQQKQETIVAAEYDGDLALLANTPAQPECLLYSLEQAARGIVLNVN